MKRLTPKAQLLNLVAELKRDYDRWNHVLHHGSGERIWPDGTSLWLTRNHIMSYKRKIVKLCNENGIELPKEMDDIPTPPAMPDDYMVAGTPHFEERMERMRLRYGFRPVVCDRNGQVCMDFIDG